MNSHSPDTDPTKLSASERAALKHEFRAFMEEHPATPKPFLSPYFSTIHRVQVATFASLFIFMVLGGSTFAAENAEPDDDIFYAIKTNVIESAMLGVALSDTDKARTYSKLVERRLEEAESLASTNQLTEEYVQLLGAKIEEHTDDAHEYIRTADEPNEVSDALEISTDLETTLDAHRQILEDTAAETGANAADLLEAVENQSDETEAVGDELEDELRVGSPAEADEYLSRTTEEADEAIQALAVRIEDLPEDDTFTLEIEDLLEGARESYATGLEYASEGDPQSALEQFRAALQDAEQGLIMSESTDEEILVI